MNTAADTDPPGALADAMSMTNEATQALWAWRNAVLAVADQPAAMTDLAADGETLAAALAEACVARAAVCVDLASAMLPGFGTEGV